MKHLPPQENCFHAQWAAEKRRWNSEVWVRAFKIKGESAFNNCFLKFETWRALRK